MREESSLHKVLRERPLRILYLEDDAADVELCLKALLNANLNFHCDPVATLAEFADKLASQVYDVVLADYQFAGWTGMDALALLLEKHTDIPFILVTGSLGEAKAVECFKKGIADYVVKGHLTSLSRAISQAVELKSVLEERKRADVALRESEERFRTLAETEAAAILIYQGTECRYANRAAEEISGYTQRELLAMSSWEVIHPDSRDVLIEQGLARLQGERCPQRFEIKILRKDGGARWLDITMGRIKLGGRPAGLFTAFDITERKSAEEEIRQLAASDPLTGLANYRRLADVFEAEAKRAQRTGRPFALLVLDLDGLKSINDAHGHLAGTRALCRVANVLREQCRNMDTAARYGGDEFAVILPETGMEGAQGLVRRICERLSKDGQQPPLSLSIGAAVHSRDGQTVEELFGTADQALYEIKKRGGGKLALLG